MGYTSNSLPIGARGPCTSQQPEMQRKRQSVCSVATNIIFYSYSPLLCGWWMLCILHRLTNLRRVGEYKSCNDLRWLLFKWPAVQIHTIPAGVLLPQSGDEFFWFLQRCLPNRVSIINLVYLPSVAVVFLAFTSIGEQFKHFIFGQFLVATSFSCELWPRN